MRRALWIKALALLGGIWLVIGSVLYVVGKARPSPESVMRYAQENSLEGKSAADRDKVMQELAHKLNQLTFEERRELRLGKSMEGFYAGLDQAERARFVELTFPTGFKQMMEAFNKMTPPERKKAVNRALADIRRRDNDEGPFRADDPVGQKIIEKGLQAFYSEASADTKMDFAPVLEEMQRNMQGLQ